VPGKKIFSWMPGEQRKGHLTARASPVSRREGGPPLRGATWVPAIFVGSVVRPASLAALAAQPPLE
jgi:hypothetical protein